MRWPITDRGHLLLNGAVDLAILTVRANLLQVLIVERNNDPYRGESALPGGFLRAEEDLREAAERELHEETGYDLAPGGETVPLGFFFTSAGLTDEHCYFFLVRPVRRARVHKREEGEAILECRAVDADELSRMIAQNEIRDSNTLAICARLAARGLISLGPS